MRWCIKRRHEGLPAFGGEVELLPIGKGFSRSGQGAIEHKVADAALGCSGGLLQGLLGRRGETQIELFAAFFVAATCRNHAWALLLWQL